MDAVALREMVVRWLAEDVGTGDVTTRATVPAGTRARAHIRHKAPGVVSGLEAAKMTFEVADPEAEVRLLTEDGSHNENGTVVLEVTGTAQGILEAERTALNLLQRLSGVATLTKQYVDEAAKAGTQTKVLDTRKTTPGLRLLEKEAVRHGGGHNHRIGLYDAVLIKENHIAAAGGIANAVRAAQEQAKGLLIECEVRDLSELEQALDAGAPRVLLDNMSVEELANAVALTDDRAETEASGNVNLTTIREIAATGVTYVSVGALTHSAPALDLSLILERLP